MPYRSIIISNTFILIGYILLGFNSFTYLIFLGVNTAIIIATYIVYAWDIKVNNAKKISQKIESALEIFFFLLPCSLVSLPFLLILMEYNIFQHLNITSRNHFNGFLFSLLITAVMTGIYEMRRAYRIKFQGLKLFYMPLWAVTFFIFSAFISFIPYSSRYPAAVFIVGLIIIKSVIEVILEYDLSKLKRT